MTLGIRRVFVLASLLAACGGAAHKPPPATPTPAVSSSDKPVAKSSYACPAPITTPFRVVQQDGISANAELQTSRDGKILAARTSATEIQIWNVASASKVSMLPSKTAIVRWALRPDGRMIAIVSEGKLVLIDLAGVRTPVSLPAGDIERLDWTADGKSVFVTRGAQTDLVDGKTAAVTGMVGASAATGGISPDGRFLLARDGALWDVRANKTSWKAASTPLSAAFSDDGSTLAFASNEKTVSVVEAPSGAKKWELATTGKHEGDVAISGDGKNVAMYDTGEYRYPKPEAVDQGLAVWVKGKRVRLAAKDAIPLRPTFSPDGKSLAYLSGGGYNGVGYQMTTVSIGGGRGKVSQGEIKLEPPRWTADGKTVLQPSSQGLVMFDPVKGDRKLVGRATTSINQPGVVYDALWSSDDNTLLVLAEQPGRAAATLVDLKTATVLKTLDAKAGTKNSPYGRRFLAAEWSAEAGIVAMVRGDGIAIWDPKAPEPMRVLDAEGETEQRLMAMPTKGNLVATSSNGTKDIRIWDPKTGAKLRTITLEDGSVDTLSFSADGTRIAVATMQASATGEQTAEIFLFDATTGAAVRTLHAPARQVWFGRSSAVHWAPQGKALVSIDGQGKVDLWNPTNDDAPLSLVERVSPATATALMDGGNYLLTGGSALEVWDLRTRVLARDFSVDATPIRHLRGAHGGGVFAASRGDHVDLYRVSDGGHLVLRVAAQGLMVNGDNGAFTGVKDLASLSQLRVRDGAELDVRPIRPNELATLARPTLAADFVAGCPLDSAP